MYDSILLSKSTQDKKALTIASQLETAIWQGDTASANGNLNKFDGLIKLIGAASGVVDANVSGFVSGGPVASITASNVIALLDGVYKAIPAKVVAADDMTIFVGQDTFRTYTIALKNANMFNYAFDGKADSEFVLPGTPIKVVAVQGLNGTNDIFDFKIKQLILRYRLIKRRREV